MDNKKKKLIDHGFIPDIFKEQDLILGSANSLSGKVINLSRDWEPFLPPSEGQLRSGVETVSCVSFGLCNIIEIMSDLLYFSFQSPSEKNYSDRFLAINSGTTPRGNSVLKVADTLRHGGLVGEEALPFSSDIKSFSEYHSPKPLPRHLLNIGKKWTNQFNFGYEWVFNDSVPKKDRPNLIWNALQFSPVGVSVLAWIKDGNSYTKPKGAIDNHFTVIFGGEKGSHFTIFYSYPNSDSDYIKILPWNYDFGQAHKFSLEKKFEKEDNWFERFIKFFYQ